MGMDVSDMDSDLMAAITASLEDSSQGSQSSAQSSEIKTVKNPEPKYSPPDVVVIDDDDDDEMLRQALEMSKQVNQPQQQPSGVQPTNQQSAREVKTEPKVEEKKRELKVPEEPAADTPSSNITKMVIRLPSK